MSVPQVLLAGVAAACLVNGVAKYVRKERRQTALKLVASVTVWGAIAVFALFPAWAREASSRAGFGGTLDGIIFIAFIVVFAILFKLLAIIERLERNISEIVRAKALDEIHQQARPPHISRGAGL